MKNILRKAMTILGSVVLIGSTIGVASAASYPSPFTSNTVIVTGASAAPSDNLAAGLIASNLDASAPATLGTVTSTTGDIVSLDSGSTKIFLDTSLDSAKTTLTRNDLPTVLGDYTFSGNVDSKITSIIKIGGSDKVTFDNQPSSNDDPVVGIALSTSTGSPLYTESITMPKINFTSSDSAGETLHLFGKDFVVSTATDANDLVLFSSAKEVNLVAGGSSPNPTATVVINGTSYDIGLVTGDSGSATISVNGQSKKITEGNSKKVGGIDIAVKSVTSSAALSTVTTNVLVGSNKLTFTNGSAVTTGSDGDPIDGTLVTFTGTPDKLTGLSIAVSAPDSSNDAILAGTPFVDPVFGSFKIDFSGLTSPLKDNARGTIKIDKSGDKGMSLTLTDSNSNTKTFDFAYNDSGATTLSDTSSNPIKVIEGASLSQDDYTIVGNEDSGHLIQVTRIYNSTTGSNSVSNDKVQFKDVLSGDTYNMDSPTTEGTGLVTIGSNQYTVTYKGSGDTGNVTLAYPSTTKHVSGDIVVFPTIKTENGALVSLYEPQNVSLTSLAGQNLLFPNGDGYTSGAIATDGVGNYTLGSSDLNATGVNLTVGQLRYNFGQLDANNYTLISLINPSTNATIDEPAVVLIEAKDDNSNYEAIVTPLTNSAGTSSSPLNIASVDFTSPTVYTKTLKSDTNIQQDVDWYGTFVSEDSSGDQTTVTISYPKSQAYAQIYVGEIGASVSGGATNVGVRTITDTNIASAAGKNIIVVGGSAINSVAASLLGGAYSGAAFTSATGVANGQFLIESFPRTGGETALLVAGYTGPDTTKAVTYLLNNNVDTTVAKKYVGTSATEASLVVA